MGSNLLFPGALGIPFTMDSAPNCFGGFNNGFEMECCEIVCTHKTTYSCKNDFCEWPHGSFHVVHDNEPAPGHEPNSSTEFSEILVPRVFPKKVGNQNSALPPDSGTLSGQLREANSPWL